MPILSYIAVAVLALAALAGAVTLSALGVDTGADTAWKAFLGLVAFLVGTHTPPPPGVAGGRK